MNLPILILGATGYVGGRLAPLLLQQGYHVRIMVRNPQKIYSRPWGQHPQLEIMSGDIHNLAEVQQAVQGCGIAYYLIHCMNPKHKDFSYADRQAAYNMVKACHQSSLQRIIYLSGLLPQDSNISTHLRSRGEVAEILQLAGISVTILRAAQLIGAGSASFEMIRYLVDRLPIMVTPRWTHIRTQPISITDTLNYLTGVLTCPATIGQTFDIGGPDILKYKDLFQLYAKVSGLRRRIMIPSPWISLQLSAFWVSLVTPIPEALARPLIEGMPNEVICSENKIRELIPLELTPIKVAFERARGHLRHQSVKSCWFDAGMPSVPEWTFHGDPDYAKGTVLNDCYRVRLAATPTEVWKPIVHIGGSNGWYSKNILWKIRGLMDKLIGGPGMQRGRRSQEELFIGDGLDFWRVLNIIPEKQLLLLTEMRLPGEGLLDLHLEPNPDQTTDLSLRLYFRPQGLPGFMYWYSVSPFHKMVFMGMLKTIAKRIEKPILKGPERISIPWTVDESC